MSRSKTLTPEEELERQRNAVRTQLALTEKGQPKAAGGNLVVIFKEDPWFQNQFKINDMSQDLYWRNELFEENHISEIQQFLLMEYNLPYSRNAIADEALSRGQLQRFNPVKDYLETITWDGVSRIESILTDVLHVEASPLYVAYITKWLVAMVARVYEPGIKFDNMLCLIGPQGAGKGRFLQCLGGDWYGSPDGHKVNDRDSKMNLHYSWINEIQEVDKLSNKADSRDVKTALSTQVDIFRAPYERKSKAYKRKFGFSGTANEPEGILVDHTGARRWWIIEILCALGIDVGYLEGIRDQIWSEVVTLYRAGTVSIYLESEELKQLQVEASVPYQAYDPYEDLLMKALPRVEQNLAVIWNSAKVKGLTGLELFGMIEVPEHLRVSGAGNIMRFLAPALKKLGWQKEQNGGRKDRATRWFPADWEEIVKPKKPVWGLPPSGMAPIPIHPGIQIPQQ